MDLLVSKYHYRSVQFPFFIYRKNYDATSFTMNDKPETAGNKGCMAWFFLGHYGFLHFEYAIFLLVYYGLDATSNKLLLIGVAAFFLEFIISFICQKQMESRVSVQIGTLFFLPYLRIFPMHLMILLSQIVGWKPNLPFLGLKMGADFLLFMLYE